jgi:uncharacterized protein involved in exopolysaccharide biosynthesis
LSGLAAQFGVSVGATGSQSPDFYAEVLQSHQILSQLADTILVFPDGGTMRRGTLADFYDVDNESPAVRREDAIRKLSENLSVSTVLRTGAVRFSVQSRWPGLSLVLAERLVEAVNAFNLQSRQSQATAERRFNEDQLLSAGGELKAAEAKLLSFEQQNRVYSSPDLSLAHDRLRRAVDMQQQVYTSLLQAYEQARLDEVRNTPAITIVDTPYLPVRPDSRHIVMKTLLALFLGAALAVIAVLMQELSLRRRVPEAPAVSP